MHHEGRLTRALGCLTTPLGATLATLVALSLAVILLVPTVLYSDQAFYMGLAKNIAEGRGMSLQGVPTAFVTPGYPLLVAGAAAITPDHAALLVVLAQAVMLSLTGLMARSLGAQIGIRGRWQALVQYAVALYPPFVLAAASILTEIPFVFSVMLAVWLWALVLKRWGGATRGHRVRLLIAVAASTVALVAVRPTGVLVAVAVFVVAAVMLLKGRRAAAVPAMAYVCAAMVGALLFVAVWGSRNLLELGRFVPLSTEGSAVAFYGNQVAAQGVGGGASLYLTTGLEQAQRIIAMPEVQRSDEFSRLLVKEVRAQPLQVLQLVPLKALRFWLNLGFPRPPSKATLLVALGNALVLALDVLYMAVGRRRIATTGSQLELVIVVFCLLLFLTHLASYSVVRYSYPAIALLLVPAVGGVSYSWYLLTGRVGNVRGSLER